MSQVSSSDTFAGQPTQNVGISFLKGYAAVCLEGAIIVLACIIFTKFASTRRWLMQMRHLRPWSGSTEVRGRAGVQHAGAGGISQDERCHRQGNDGTLSCRRKGHDSEELLLLPFSACFLR